MTTKIFSEGLHKQTINDQPIIDKKYKISVNPNNKDNVYVSVTNNGVKLNKIYDTLEEFFQGFSQDYSLFNSLQRDIDEIEQFPSAIFKYTPKNFKRKSNNNTKKNNKKQKSFRKPRRKSNK